MRSFSVALALATALAGLGMPEAALAQQDTTAGPRFREAFASVPDGRTVRILRASGTTVGRFSGLAGDSLSLLPNGGPPVILALDEVEAAWSRKRNAGKGALIGGIIGVVLGGIVGYGLADFCETCGSDPSYAGSAIGGALIVGALSAGVGALIGAAIPGWKRIDPDTMK